MMKNREKIYLVFQSNTLETSKEVTGIVTDWYLLSQIVSSSTLTYYEGLDGEKRKIEASELNHELSELKKESTCYFEIKNAEIESQLTLFNQKIFQSILIEKSVFEKFKVIFLDYLDQLMIKHGLYAFARSYEEYLVHNLEDVAEREQLVTEHPVEIRLMKNDMGEVMVDCSQYSGYNLIYNELCLTSCWKMWFSMDYYHLIPKQAFLDVQQVDEVKELPAEVVRVTLFHSPFDWKLKANREFQSIFRRQLGFEQIEWINGVGILEQPCTEFIQSQDKTQMIQYQNKNMQPVEKTEATHFTARIFNYAQHLYIESRRSGRLNYQAYFPFEISETGERLVYWILHPEYCIDDGIEAFRYYIDYYLEAQNKLVSPEKLKTNLNFYIPISIYKKLDKKKLKHMFTSSEAKLYQVEDPFQLYIAKNGESLTVQFRPIESLEEDARNWVFAKPKTIKPRTEEISSNNFFSHRKLPKK